MEDKNFEMFKEKGKIEYLFYVLNRKYEIIDFENCKE